MRKGVARGSAARSRYFRPKGEQVAIELLILARLLCYDARVVVLVQIPEFVLGGHSVHTLCLTQ